MLERKKQTDAGFSVEFQHEETGEILCQRCGHKQARRERNVCEECDKFIPDGEVRMGWKSESKKLYSGMEKIFPHEEESSPAVKISASRRSFHWQYITRNAIFAVLLILAFSYAILFATKMTLGKTEWKKVEHSITESMPKELTPLIKQICE
jgi:ribosomal protein L37E